MTPRLTVLAAALVAFVPSSAVAQSRAGAPAAQAGQLSPQEQQSVNAQIAAPKLNPAATVTLDLKNTSFRDIIAAVAQAGSLTVRYHSGVTNLDAPANAKLTNATLDDSLQTVMQSRGLAYKVTGPRSVFIYPNTPENREKYADAVRTFTVVNANVNTLGQILNRELTAAGPDDVRPVIVSASSAGVIVVRATPDVMAKVAKIIADNDKR